MKLGFTGTSKGMTNYQFNQVRDFLNTYSHEITEAHHGDCVGADYEFHEFVRALLNVPIIGHIPINPNRRAFCKFDETRPPKNYLARNRDIIIESTHLIATPYSEKEQLRSGTWATIRYAIKYRIPIFIFPPK